MNDTNQLQDALRQHAGSETWTRHGLNREVLATEGALFFFENAGGGAFWLWDIIASELPKFAKEQGTVFVTFTVAGTKGVIIADDGGRGDTEGGEKKTELWRKEISFTDTPEGEWKLWMSWDGEHYVILLPSEY